MQFTLVKVGVEMTKRNFTVTLPSPLKEEGKWNNKFIIEDTHVVFLQKCSKCEKKKKEMWAIFNFLVLGLRYLSGHLLTY